MVDQFWRSSLYPSDVLVVPPPVSAPGFGDQVVLFFLALDSTLRWATWWMWIALLKFLLVSIAGVALNGVYWFEFSPTAFYLLWLPATLVSYVKWAYWLGLKLRPLMVLLWEWVFGRTALGWLLECAVAWLLRGSLAPPPVSQAEDVFVSLGLDQGENRAYVLGMGYAQEANVTHASVTAGGLTPSRLRSRSTWTNRLQHYLGGRPGVVGQLVRRRWTPDLPSSDRPHSANALLGLLDGDAKLLGGGVLPSTSGDRQFPFLVVETEKGRVVTAPDLLAHLYLYACFRPRTQDLLAGLRSRAREWFKENGIADLASAFLLPDTVAIAFSESAPERLARERLDASEVPPSC
jgi:hypothetical protein